MNLGAGVVVVGLGVVVVELLETGEFTPVLAQSGYSE